MSKFSNVWVWFAELIDKSGSRFDVSQAARKIADSPLADRRFFPGKGITNSDSPYTPTEDDIYIFANPDAGAITINLPQGIDLRYYSIKNVADTGANTVTVNAFDAGDGTEQIDGANFQTLGKNVSVTIVFVDSRSEWFIV